MAGFDPSIEDVTRCPARTAALGVWMRSRLSGRTSAGDVGIGVPVVSLLRLRLVVPAGLAAQLVDASLLGSLTRASRSLIKLAVRSRPRRPLRERYKIPPV